MVIKLLALLLAFNALISAQVGFEVSVNLCFQGKPLLPNRPLHKAVGNTTLKTFALYVSRSLNEDPDPKVCKDAVLQITDKCLPFFYGGQAVNKDYLFNLTSLRDAQDPLLPNVSVKRPSPFKPTTKLPTDALRDHCYFRRSCVCDGWATTDFLDAESRYPNVKHEDVELYQNDVAVIVFNRRISYGEHSADFAIRHRHEFPTQEAHCSLPIPMIVQRLFLRLYRHKALMKKVAKALTSRITVFNNFGEAIIIAGGLASAAAIEEASLSKLADDLAQSFASASGALEFIELTDFSNQPSASVGAVKALEDPLRGSISNLRSLLEALRQVVQNKLTRKDNFTRYYVLIIAEAASIGALRKGFDVTVAVATTSQLKSMTSQMSPSISSSSGTATITLHRRQQPQQHQSLQNRKTSKVYVIHTKAGTPLAAFKAFIEDLDGAAGRWNYMPIISFQSYVNQLRMAQLAEVKKAPTVKKHLAEQLGWWWTCEVSRTAKDERMPGQLSKRAPQSPYIIQEGSADNLQLISQAKDVLGKVEPLSDHKYHSKAVLNAAFVWVEKDLADKRRSGKSVTEPSFVNTTLNASVLKTVVLLLLGAFTQMGPCGLRLRLPILMVSCLDKGGSDHKDDGTSLSAPVVSGLAVYFLTLPDENLQQLPKNEDLVEATKNLIIKYAYARTENIIGPKGPKEDELHKSYKSPTSLNVVFNNAIEICKIGGGKPKRDGTCTDTVSPLTTKTTSTVFSFSRTVMPPSITSATTTLAPPVRQYSGSEVIPKILPPTQRKMFSGSHSYLGGGSSGRGPAQHGQQPQYSSPQPPQQQQQQPQPNGFAPQPTGYGSQPLQSQYTGYPGQLQQQPQPTGVAPSQSFQQSQFQNQQQQQQYSQQQQPQFLQPQATAAPFQQQQQTAQPVNPQPTGQTSSQMAASFRSNAPSVPPPSSTIKPGSRIPNIRLSFVTAQDQAKFETLFKSAVGVGSALSGQLTQLIHMTLSDTTKSGQLLFPEFALAMYLCNIKLVGKELPSALPERILNEVSSMVDIISFNVADSAPPPVPKSNAPSFDAPLRQNTLSPPAPQQPQPQQPSNAQLLSQLSAQQTGFQPQPTGFQPQPTGFQPQSTGYSNQTGFQPQQTGFQSQTPGIQSQPTDISTYSPSQAGVYNGPRPPMPPMPTGIGQGLSPSATGIASLNAQPTGRPGQWGLVNAPATGLPNIDALHQRMMPQKGREGGFTTVGLAGNATVPWAVTKDEKRIYDNLFKQWDGFGRGYIGGGEAIEAFGQSGLDKPDLERIWALADAGNKGRLNMDEFAVAMHLIYRKLNGYPVPNRLPPELVPPSTRNFSDSIGTVKSLLSQDAESRKNTSAGLLPQRTGVSYLKTHSFRSDPGSSFGRKDGTVFKNNDDDFGFRSSARRRIGGDGRSPSPAQPSSPSSERSTDDLSIEQLKKNIREKQALLDAIDFKDENAADEDEALDRRDRREAEDLYRRIRRVQEDIDGHPDAALRLVDSSAEKRTLKRQLQGLTDKLPDIASRARRAERSIADAKLELFRLKDAKAYPNSANAVIGTGPGGSITESDRLKARAKAMMQQRSAALTGKSAPSNSDDPLAAPKRFEAETSRVKTERETNERMVQDVEDSVRDFSGGLADGLKATDENATSEHEKRRWEDGLGVEDEVKEFIYDLQRSSRVTRTRREDHDRSSPTAFRSYSSYDRADSSRAPGRSESPMSTTSSSTTRQINTPASTGASSGSATRTAEERAAFIKQQAEQRMAERLAALGIRPASKPSETSSSRVDREKKEKEEKLRLAEEEDERREKDRQRRLEGEQISPPSPKQSKKKPAPPPSRKSTRTQSADLKPKTEENARREQEERELRIEQEAQQTARRSMEEEASRQELELAKEREAAQARLKALEVQMQQGKIKKEEEKRKRQAAQKEAKEKEARLAAQRAELEAVREQERQLQLRLQQLDEEESSDDEGPQQITPPEMTPSTSQELPRDKSSQPLPAPSLSISSPASPPSAPVPQNTETTNPFFKIRPQKEETPTPSIKSTTTSSADPSAEGPSSTNPFYRKAEAAKGPSAEPITASATSGMRPRRTRPEEDDFGSSASSDDDDDDSGPPVGRQASALASRLFGRMGPQRPGSGMGSPKPEATGPPGAGDSGPPPPPPLPTGGAPPAPPAPPPPPPPPMPNLGGGGGAGTGRGALLADISSGRSLKKVETKDRSSSSSAGRVLD
ncbi:MAG: actin organization and endocytosis protein [Vezdaea aestivalis]|nr:MAG: actin organization and endocytosis protein [Vezdaea aestivalis]